MVNIDKCRNCDYFIEDEDVKEAVCKIYKIQAYIISKECGKEPKCL